MFEITELEMNGHRKIISTRNTFECAKAEAVAMGVSYMEDDADYPGCADAYLTDGRVIAIQPVGFKVTE